MHTCNVRYYLLIISLRIFAQGQISLSIYQNGRSNSKVKCLIRSKMKTWVFYYYWLERFYPFQLTVFDRILGLPGWPNLGTQAFFGHLVILLTHKRSNKISLAKQLIGATLFGAKKHQKVLDMTHIYTYTLVIEDWTDNMKSSQDWNVPYGTFACNFNSLAKRHSLLISMMKQ